MIDFTFCHQMQCRTTSVDAFNILCDFFNNQNCHGSDVWEYVPTEQL